MKYENKRPLTHKVAIAVFFGRLALLDKYSSVCPPNFFSKFFGEIFWRDEDESFFAKTSAIIKVLADKSKDKGTEKGTACPDFRIGMFCLFRPLKTWFSFAFF